MFEKLNKYKTTIREGISLENMEFKPLNDFTGQTLKVDGYFFTNGKYGKQVVVIANGYKINMPNRAVEQFEEIMASEEMNKAVLQGKLALTDIKVIETKHGLSVAYKTVDC